MSFISDDLRPLDEQAFGARVEPRRRELHLHRYRLLGSFEDAEDLVQEAFLRAWRRRETYGTFGGALFEHFDLPATVSAAVGTR